MLFIFLKAPVFAENRKMSALKKYFLGNSFESGFDMQHYLERRQNDAIKDILNIYSQPLLREPKLFPEHSSTVSQEKIKFIRLD